MASRLDTAQGSNESSAFNVGISAGIAGNDAGSLSVTGSVHGASGDHSRA
ncbi:hypothetical protein [Roseibium sp. RKSG952]|nr:hypothetical protein [Roseibium sp. RKSG952]